MADRASSKGYIQYLQNVVIDSSPSPRKFIDVAAPFQWHRSNLIAGPIEQLAGIRTDYTGPRSVYVELPRGCDKTGHSSRMLAWLLAYSKKRLKMFAFAADQDQSVLLRDAMDAEIKLNPFLRGKIQVLRKFAWGPGGTVEFLASDADSAHGKTPSLLCADEFSHINGERGEQFFNAIFSAKEKRSDCVTLITSNAGFRSSWQWRVREAARTSPDWLFYASEPGTHPAPWMSMRSIEETGRFMLKSEYKRLFLNFWIDDSVENGFVTRGEVNSCVDPSLRSTKSGDYNTKRYVGVDYGPKKDRTAICVVHRKFNGRVVVDQMHCWHRPGGLVLVDEVDKALDHIIANYKSLHIVCDSYQLESSIQRLEAKRVSVERFAPRGGAGNAEMAACLRSQIVNAKIAWPENCGTITLPHNLDDPAFPIDSLREDTLESELSNLIIRSTPSGYRFDHTSNKHDDRVVALAMGTLAAVSDPLPPPSLPAPISVNPPQRDLTQLPFAKNRGIFGVSA